jgi:hypothetical protein
MLAMVIAVNAYADETYPLELEYGVDPINELAVSDGAITLGISTAVAGAQPTSATDISSSYDFTTNETLRKITGQLSSNMPANTSLKVTLAVPAGWTSADQQTLTADSAVTLSTGDQGGGTGLQISYEFAATAAAGVISSNSRTVTYTLTPQ